jgi:DNA-binding response OmpR family regulator
MSAQKPIFVIESNDFVGKKLAEALSCHGFEQDVSIVSKMPKEADSAVIELSSSVRIGDVLDQITHILRSDGGSDDVLAMGAYRLDRYQGLFYGLEDNVVKLTEKEVSLLVLLYEAGGDTVARDVILDAVWQYAESVETHTLETHIYRLRQKIEADPANPEFLCTGEQGYYLSLS